MTGPDPAREARQPRRRGGGTRIVLGLLAGVACGLFFGELVGWLSVVGDVYIGLLQMTVLPYVFVALVSKIPRLKAHGGGQFALRAAVVLGLLWLLGCLTIVVVPHVLPEWRSAHFFSSFGSGIAEVDFLELYVPVNPFSSLARGIVPAIVVFAISVGLALANTPGHERLVAHLDLLNESFGRIAGFLTRFMPLGVFALAAGAAGTMTVEEFSRLQGYLVVYVLAVALLVFGLLPSLIAAFTPFSRREFLSAAREPMIAAFATGKLFVVLPALVDATTRLFESRGLEPDNARARASVLVPLGYAFPHLGKLMVLLFPAFAAWYRGEPLDGGGYGQLVTTGLASSFGSPLVSVPLLLDLLELPEDLFHLFLVAGVFTTRLGDLVGVGHLMALCTVAIAWSSGSMLFRGRGLARSFAGMVLVGLPLFVGARAFLTWSLEGSYSLDAAVMRMKLVSAPQPHERLEAAAPNPVPLEDGETLLERVRRRGVLRVGFVPGAVPFSFVNQDGELVGLDMDVAHRFAADLGVGLEFVPVDRAGVVEHLREDHCDVLMAGIVGRFDLVQEVRTSRPYLEATVALVVRDHLDPDELQDLDGLRVYYTYRQRTPARIQEAFPSAELVPLDLEGQFFEVPRGEADVLLCMAEEGAVFTVLHSQYKVVNPLPRPLVLPLVYPVGERGASLAELLSRWIELQEGELLQELRTYWVRGGGTEEKSERWSIVRDVLGWAE